MGLWLENGWKTATKSTSQYLHVDHHHEPQIHCVHKNLQLQLDVAQGVDISWDSIADSWRYPRKEEPSRTFRVFTNHIQIPGYIHNMYM